MHEIRYTVYIAISTILLAIVLSFASVFIGIRNDMANTRNNEITSARSMLEYKEYNKYDNNTVYGDEVVELISLYIDTGITVYVNTPDGSSPSITIGPDTIKANPSLTKLSYLQSVFTSRREYIAQVVYNAKDPSTVEAPMKKMPGSEVTGIALKWVSNN